MISGDVGALREPHVIVPSNAVAAMTKRVTSVAAMVLVEEGKLDLDAPFENYLSEFNRQAGRARGDRAEHRQALPGAGACQAAVQVIDLLHHTTGLTGRHGRT